MPLEVREITDAPADLRRYESLVRTSPSGSVFATQGWLDYIGCPARYFGVYKGAELIAGAAIPHSGGRVPAFVDGTPWTGIVARSQDEGECLQVACEMARHLRREFGDASLTMPPEWTDIRGFLWDGWRAHVRYTYRAAYPAYEKRLKFRDCNVRIPIVHESDGWQVRYYETGDSRIDAIFDWRYAYYWRSHGGNWQPECIKTMIIQAEERGLPFDLMGCNSPERGLFKRSFGGELTPYYFVTTGDPATVKEFWGERRPLAA